MENSRSFIRRILPYVVSCAGVVVAASSLIYFVYPSELLMKITGVGFLVLALLLLWLGPTLLENDPRYWTIYYGVGVVCLAALSVNAVLLAIPDTIQWLASSGHVGVQYVPVWVVIALLLSIWTILLVLHNRTARSLWKGGSFILCGMAIWWWARLLARALDDGQTLAFLLSLFTIVPAGILVIALMKRHQVTVADRALTAAYEEYSAPQFFATPYHEWWAKGRFCEMFDLGCDHEQCPLPMRVAEKYQQLRLIHYRSPEILDILEKAYGTLVIPRQRQLCAVAHDIIKAKAKELGPERFARAEARLWTKLWNRLQDNEFRGDPQKARDGRFRLTKEL